MLDFSPNFQFHFAGKFRLLSLFQAKKRKLTQIRRVINKCSFDLSILNQSLDYETLKLTGDKSFDGALYIFKTINQALEKGHCLLIAGPEEVWEYKCKIAELENVGLPSVEQSIIEDNYLKEIQSAYFFQQLKVNHDKWQSLYDSDSREREIMELIINDNLTLKKAVVDIWMICNLNSKKRLSHLNKLSRSFGPHSYEFFKTLIQINYKPI